MGICADKPLFEQASEEIATGKPAQVAGEQTYNVTVSIIGLRGLRGPEWFPETGRSRCSCALKVAGRGEELHRTEVQRDKLEPKWAEEAEVSSFAMGEALEFYVWEEGYSFRLIGTAHLDGQYFFPVGFNGELQLSNEKGKEMDIFLKVKVKVDALVEDYPAGPPHVFSAVVEKERKNKLGAEFDTQDGVMAQLIELKEGPLLAYNDNVKPSHQLRPGDFIMEVNGTCGQAVKIVQRMKKEARLEMTVKRPQNFGIVLDKKGTGNPLGIDFLKPTGRALLINGIAQGPLERWNASNGSEAARVGDRIVAVNGQGGTAAELLSAIKAGNRFQLTIERPAEKD
mmetsp:Transcript_77112/g.218214  ORF Transcript_77112/g.218214 Transcript_77112/m.218214 type:complete len:341 (-) Transcript_77112:149-1171(-)